MRADKPIKRITSALGATALAAGCLAATFTPAAAQTRCPEGKTMSGKCVNPALAQMGTRTLVAMTQTKFSFTAPPFLPIEDRTSRIPTQSHEVYNLLNAPPVTKPVTFILLPVHGGPPTPFQLNRP